ncbi:hypothetical protein [Flavobacterium ginsenosidimutans]|uniref:DUF4595 domain-containing protein n=1 Tax=Flavobacterium ginsenosidimutans TaxID=687844 RepID=A0ABZ2QA50_9FLAO|nr:hypothetical protein [Flavobacterium ginsenosidimutans]KAF2337720.1 hypothetical protein DM444_02105 [Flavobacterium ginsenosidimutans]
MKKILCLFGALTLLLTSCSSEDSPSSDLVLLKKNVITTPEGDKITVNYKYDGNKIVSTTDDSGDVGLYYTYTGDLITKIEFKYADGTVDQINTFSYNAEGKLTTFVRVEPNMDWGHKEVYTYNADGTVTAQSFSGDGTTQTLEGTTNTIKFVNGEVSEIISEDASWENHKYTYDNKNNPTKNILGMDKIAFVDGEGNGVKFNILTDTSEGDLWTNSTFTYNENGYPVKEVNTGSDSLGTIEYFY